MKWSDPARMAAIIAAAFLVLAIVIGARYQNRRDLVQDVYSPTFPPVAVSPLVDGVKELDQHLQRPSGAEALARFIPDQSGVLWLSLLVVLVVGFDYARPWSGRNLDLLLAQAAGWLLIGSIDLLETADDFNNAGYRGLIRLVFIAVVIASLAVMGRLLLRFRSPDLTTWAPSLDVRVIATIATFVMVLSVLAPFFQKPDDSSYFTGLGGQRLRERHELPYGDPMLTKTPGAAYGPLMYAVQAGAQFALAQDVNTDSPDLPKLGGGSTYRAPAPFPAQLSLAIFQLLACFVLYQLGRDWGGPSLGFAFIALYSGSSYVLGIGGTTELIGGMTYVSHIIPPAAALLAYRYLDRPALSGALLAAAAGLGFYPAFFFPAWLAYQWGASARAAIKFFAGFAVVCGVIGLWVLMASRPAPPLGLIPTILRDTLGHHTDLEGYGSSTFGLWGQQTGFLHWMLAPMAGTSALTSPFFLLFCGYLLITAVMAVGAGPVGLALLTATIAIGANVWKIHATATYVTWYYSFLLLGTLGPGALVLRAGSRSRNGHTETT